MREELMKFGFVIGILFCVLLASLFVSPSGAIASGCVKKGCNGELCVAETENVRSPCVWRPEYTCYKSARCERQSNGECGWIKTSQLLQCLNQKSSGEAPAQGHAASEQHCKNYANVAVAQQQQNLQRGCGFKDGYGYVGWNSDWNRHFNWCLQLPEERSNFHLQKRWGILNEKCQTRSTGQFCLWYARTSVEQQEENLKRQCGFSYGAGGVGWSTNYSAHLNWCSSAPAQMAEDRINKRSTMLKNCKNP